MDIVGDLVLSDLDRAIALCQHPDEITRRRLNTVSLLRIFEEIRKELILSAAEIPPVKKTRKRK
jgi:hypothetical protein